MDGMSDRILDFRFGIWDLAESPYALTLPNSLIFYTQAPILFYQ